MKTFCLLTLLLLATAIDLCWYMAVSRSHRFVKMVPHHGFALCYNNEINPYSLCEINESYYSGADGTCRMGPCFGKLSDAVQKQYIRESHADMDRFIANSTTTEQ